MHIHLYLSRHELIQMRRELVRWHEGNARSYPWRQTRDPWCVLVAELLLKQTHVRKVEPAYHHVLRICPTPLHAAGANPDELAEAIAPLGLVYRSKELVRIGQEISSRFGGRVPQRYKDLKSIHGIGDYSASAIRTFAFSKREPVLDTNIIRLLKRLVDLDRPVRKILPTVPMRALARSLVPMSDPRGFNYALLDFTALVCTHYNPACDTCVIHDHCHAPGSI